MGKDTFKDKELFVKKNAFLREYFEEVSPLDFYRELFPEGSLGVAGDLDTRKPNMIVATCYRKTPEEIDAINAKEKEERQAYEEKRERGEEPPRPKRYRRTVVHNRLVFDDFGELPELLANEDELMEWVIIPPVAFSGKQRTKKNGYHAWGIAVDLDGVEMPQLEDLLFQIENDVVPEPTFIVNSGHGMHLYYCFEDPVPLYPYLEKQLKTLKDAMVECIWNAYTSTISTEKRQYQSVVQGYRAVGSCSKLGKGYKVTAFRIGRKRTLQYLMDWATESDRVDYNEFTHVTLDEAAKLWPEWYEHRVFLGESRRPFKFKHRGVYNSWLRRMALGAYDGNRYHCIAVLFSIAFRTEGMTFDEVLHDALDLVPRLNRLTKDPTNEFTEEDVLFASSYYSSQFQSLGLKSVYKMTKIYIEPAKRNKRARAEHLKRARKLQEADYPNGEWRYKGGAPKAKDKVHEYRFEHPDASVTEVARALGISRTTVYKWWELPEPPVTTRGKMVPVHPSKELSDVIIRELKKDEFLKNENKKYIRDPKAIP